MRKFVIGLVAVCTLLFMTVIPAFALDNRTGGRITVGANETVNDDLLITGTTAVIEGTVNGDVLAFANYVDVRGTINGNLVTAGRSVHVTGAVTGSVYAAGDDVTVDGRVDGSLVSAGSQTTVSNKASVGHSWIGLGDRLALYGKVGRGMLTAASTTSVEGSVGQELTAGGGDISVGPNSTIGGPVTYYSDREATIDSAARTGEVTFHPTNRNSGDWSGFAHWMNSWWIGFKFVGFMLAGLAVLALFPTLRRRYPQLVVEKPWQMPAAGLIALFAYPIAAIILLATVIGIPVSVIAMLLFPPLLYFGQILVAWACGKLLGDYVPFMKDWSWPLLFLAGAVLTTLCTHVPAVNWVFSLGFLAYGLGGLFYLVTDSRTRNLA